MKSFKEMMLCYQTFRRVGNFLSDPLPDTINDSSKSSYSVTGDIMYSSILNCQLSIQSTVK